MSLPPIVVTLRDGSLRYYARDGRIVTAEGRALGDVVGHEFHGNQYTSGHGGGADVAEQHAAEIDAYVAKGHKVFHGTSDEAWNQIRKEGLIPKKRSGADAYAGAPDYVQFAGDRKASIYVSGDLDTATGFAKYVAKKRGEDPVVLEVAVPEEFWGTRVKEDEQAPPFMDAYRIVGPVPPQYIKRSPILGEDPGLTGGGRLLAKHPRTLYVVLFAKKTVRTAGDVEGHPFHGNQWTTGQSGTGEWKAKGGFKNTGIVWKQDVDPKTGRPIPIKVASVEEAVALVLDGKVVEVPDPKAAHTVITRLADMAREAKAAGKNAPDYDLCQVSVAHTNLFCAESIRTPEYPNGIPRIEMPQLGGKPVPGSEADKLPRNPWNPEEVDGAAHFIAHLQAIGMKTTRETVGCDTLKATQREMKGQTVASMMADVTFKPESNPIFVSSDNYIVDGHHRWATMVGRDAENGVLGDSKMPIVRVNAPISEVLHLATSFGLTFGIQQAPGLVKQAEAMGIHHLKGQP